jgi:hypothetical protein
VGSLGAARRDGVLGAGPGAKDTGLVLFEAIAWGLLWSAALDNALIAGILAVISLLVVSLGPAPARIRREPGGRGPRRLASADGRAGAGDVAMADHAPAAAGRWARNRATSRTPTRPDPAAGRPRRPAAGPVVLSLAWQTCREARTTWLVWA